MHQTGGIRECFAREKQITCMRLGKSFKFVNSSEL